MIRIGLIPENISTADGISIFLAWEGKFPGVGSLELSDLPGVRTKKEGNLNALSSANTALFFTDRTVK